MFGRLRWRVKCPPWVLLVRHILDNGLLVREVWFECWVVGKEGVGSDGENLLRRLIALGRPFGSPTCKGRCRQ